MENIFQTIGGGGPPKNFLPLFKGGLIFFFSIFEKS